jgi:predicted transcriptional regulator
MAFEGKVGQVLKHIGCHPSRGGCLNERRYRRRIYFVSIRIEDMKMSKQAVFTMKLEPELREEFMAEAEASHRPASQIVREMMRQFVQTQRESREYEAFLQRKVDSARISMRAGEGLTNEEVEAQFAARRAQVTKKG